MEVCKIDSHVSRRFPTIHLKNRRTFALFTNNELSKLGQGDCTRRVYSIETLCTLIFSIYRITIRAGIESTSLHSRHAYLLVPERQSTRLLSRSSTKLDLRFRWQTTGDSSLAGDEGGSTGSILTRYRRHGLSCVGGFGCTRPIPRQMRAIIVRSGWQPSAFTWAINIPRVRG